MADALRVLVLVALTAGLALLARTTPLGDTLDSLARAIVQLSHFAWALPVFVAFYAVTVAVGLPGTALTLLGGAAFGFFPGVLVNLCSGVLAAALAYGIARALGYDLVVRRLGDRVAFLSGLTDRRRTFFLFARLRLVPFLPYSVVNYGAGVTGAPFGAFLAGTAVGIVPSTLLWTYFANAVLAGGEPLRRAVGLRIAIALGGLLVLSVAPHVWGHVTQRRR